MRKVGSFKSSELEGKEENRGRPKITLVEIVKIEI